MIFPKSWCPGSRAIREPTPEYLNCPNCGEEVEVWTHELSYPCPRCGTEVMREQRPSCIDWCPHAEECIGPTLYMRLKPDKATKSVGAGVPPPLDILGQEHEEALKQVSLLRVALLRLSTGARGSALQFSQAPDQSIAHLTPVWEFFDGKLSLHFRREEEALFPLLERHTGEKGSPIGLLLAEHADIHRLYEALKAKLAELERDESGAAPARAGEIYQAGSNLASLLERHVRKENESLLPLTRGLLKAEELAELSCRWFSLSSPKG